MFESDVTTKILAGDMALQNLPYELKYYGCKRPMLICDDMSYRLDTLSILLKAFDNDDIKFQVVYQKVPEVATVQCCESLVKLYRAKDCDAIVALGRKAVAACAKTVKVMLREGVSFLSFYTSNTVGAVGADEGSDCPLFFVPTHFDAGIESCGFTRVYDAERIYEFDTKYGGINAVVVDERMSDVMPPKAVLSGCLCALGMATEALTCAGAKAQAYAIASMEAFNIYFHTAFTRNGNKEARTRMLLATVTAGVAYGMMPRQIIAEVADAISDAYKINYGNVFAVLFPHYFEKQIDGGVDASRALLYLSDENTYIMCNPKSRSAFAADKLNAVYDDIAKYTPYKRKLSELGVERERLVSFAEQAINSHGDKSDDEATFSFLMSVLESAF